MASAVAKAAVGVAVAGFSVILASCSDKSSVGQARPTTTTTTVDAADDELRGVEVNVDNLAEAADPHLRDLDSPSSGWIELTSPNEFELRALATYEETGADTFDGASADVVKTLRYGSDRVAVKLSVNASSIVVVLFGRTS